MCAIEKQSTPVHLCNLKIELELLDNSQSLHKYLDFWQQAGMKQERKTFYRHLPLS